MKIIPVVMDNSQTPDQKRIDGLKEVGKAIFLNSVDLCISGGLDFTDIHRAIQVALCEAVLTMNKVFPEFSDHVLVEVFGGLNMTFKGNGMKIPDGINIDLTKAARGN